MATGRTLKLLVLTTLAAVLAGCVAGGSAEAPPGVRMDGPWKLDHSASDDPQKALDKLRKFAARTAQRHGPSGAMQATARGGRGGGRRQGGEESEDPNAGPRLQGPELLAHSPVMHELMAFITRGDYLTVHQEPERFVLDYGTSGRSFTPGSRSVVSAETGVADQYTGWKGKSYVIDVRPQVGPSITEEYSLSPDQQHLIVKLHVGSSDLPSVDLKQVYARTTDIVPRAVPLHD